MCRFSLCSAQGYKRPILQFDLLFLAMEHKEHNLFVQDGRAVRGMGRGISDHHVVLCKVRLEETWIKRREIVDEARRSRSEKLRYIYREGYAKSPEGKRVKWDGENNVEHMWEQVKRAIVESAREVCGSVRVGGRNPKNVRWNNQVKMRLKKRRCLEGGVLS